MNRSAMTRAPFADASGRPADLRALASALALAVGVAVAAALPAGQAAGQAAGQGAVIPVPLGEGETALDAEELARLTAERFDSARSRGSAADQTPARGISISPLRPVRAMGLASGNALRFEGEAQTLDFVMLVPEPDAVEALRVTVRSSINVLPERSRVRVYVNDQPVGTGELRHVTGFGEIDLPVSGVGLERGENRVRIELVQHHRIFCGPEASFALWTDIDLARSGAVLAHGPRAPGQAAFVMGLASAAARGAPVEIRGTEALGDHADAWIGQVTRHLGRVLGGDPVPFRFSARWDVQPERRPAARVTFIPGEAQRVSFRLGADGAQVMVVEYRPGEAPQPLQALEPLSTVAATTGLPLLATQQPVALSELGFRNVEVNSRYRLIEQGFRLPDDFVILTNAKAELRLDYAYAEGLPRDAMLLIHINGTNVRLLPLRGQANEWIESFPIRFEARLLRAGANTLGFEVIIPGDPADLPCPNTEETSLAIGESSTLQVPYSPSMFLPDMHFAFVNLQPESVAVNELTGRAFDRHAVATMRAALGTGGRANVSPELTRLHLLALDDLGAVPSGGHSISRRAFEAVLSDEPADPALTADAVGGGVGAGRQGGLLDLSARPETTERTGTSLAWLRAQARQALNWLHPQSGFMLESWLAEQSGQAIMLQLDPARPNQIWLLRAPGSDVGALAAAVAAARSTGDGPRGQVSVLGHDGRWHNWFAPDRQPALLEPIRLGNMRHVLGNVVSAMPVRYALTLFFLALISAAVALRLVINTREY